MTWEGGGPPVVGVDLGGTKILAGVVSANHRILGRANRNTPAKEGGPAILQAMTESVNEAIEACRRSPIRHCRRGHWLARPTGREDGGDPLQCEPERQRLSDWPGTGRRARPAGPGTERRSSGGTPSSAWRRKRLPQILIAAFVGTGIGGCIIQGGEIVTGSTANAGEVGHMVVKAGGPLCGCGAKGCMEALASKTAIQRRINKAVAGHSHGSPCKMAQGRSAQER